jgi:ornithine cyclodeaminase
VSNSVSAPKFAVVPGVQVQQILQDDIKNVMSIVEDTLLLHGNGRTVNPPSYFLQFPDRPHARIIALPASIGGDTSAVDGIKWISSFPQNITSGLPRASAVLVLNDPANGYPYACLESSVISASRTAACAAVAAQALSRDRSTPLQVGFLGTGLIARYIHRYLAGAGWAITSVNVHDLVPEYAAGFAGHLDRVGAGPVTVCGSAEQVIRESDLVVFATTAAAPHVTEPSWFDHHPLVLHVSLRDLSPDVIASSFNVVDDVDHCLKANTSVHLLEQRDGNRDFIAATLFDVLTGAVAAPADRTVVFSPFGLGVLDLAVGRHVYQEVARAGRLVTVDGFFSELERHG